MIKFNDQLERKYHKAMRHENKNKKQRSNQQTIMKNNREIENNTKIKAMGNITPTMDHYPRSGYMGDTDPYS